MKGTVARVVPDQGFGFIRGEDGGEFFFHQSALRATDFEELAPGVPVEFDVDNEPKGDEPLEHPRAIDVHLAANAIPAVDNEQLPPEKLGQG